MDKNRGRKGVLAGAAELFDLPADVVAGLPHVEVVGNREFYMENHRGILSYGGEEIAVNAEKKTPGRRDAFVLSFEGDENAALFH